MENSTTQPMSTPAKVALCCLILGGALLLGGVPFQIVLGVSRIGTRGEVEKYAYQLMSRGSVVLVAAYWVTFFAGLVQLGVNS